MARETQITIVDNLTIRPDIAAALGIEEDE